jgi:ATP-dependent Clp protease protease subunit
MTPRPDLVGPSPSEDDPPPPFNPRPGSIPPTALADWLESRMFEQRIIWITGQLDELVATAAATQLMTLDGSGDDPIQLHLSSGDGTLTAALTLMDTIAALGVPVTAVCTGRLEGPALGVLAVAHHRQAASHSRLRLRDEEIVAQGTAAALARELAQHERQLQRFIEQLGKATEQPAERVEIDVASGRYFDVEEALQYHLIDEIWHGRPQKTG